MSTCTEHGCTEPARWECCGAMLCRAHGIEAAIRTGRPAQLLAGAVVADDQAVKVEVKSCVVVEGAADPCKVWEEIDSHWETVSLEDFDEVESIVNWAIEQGMAQAEELKRLRAGGA